jgi:hypothetical protein
MVHLRKYYQQKANDTFENQIERAQRAVDECSEEYKIWCQTLLDILKQCRFATVVSKTGVSIDVQRIAYTDTWASFFDVFNQIYKFDISILPVETEELGINRKYSKLYERTI